MTKDHLLLEVAVASVEDVLASEKGKADRIELNSALALGGLTPSLATLIEAKATTSIPVMVMVRPRSAGPAYGSEDFKVMQKDIDLFLQHGADGIVFGILTDQGMIDLKRCKMLVRQMGNRQTVFHRAFDVTPDPREAINQLIDLSFCRVMTSGQQSSAYNGAPLIAELIDHVAGKIEILPAAGINRFTVADVVSRTGCNQVHASLRAPRIDTSVSANPNISFGDSLRSAEDRYDATSMESVQEMRRLLDDMRVISQYRTG